ncbi:hypothetical protein B0H14DRAFT_2659506 [Mycena olivaceomarginata]|nr:hypothetical protein B0H14DRAFT_2659506 [Mycena olivaceomarginata]
MTTHSMLYGQSKLGKILISNYFAKTHSEVLVSCSLHGSINTELTRPLQTRSSTRAASLNFGWVPTSSHCAGSMGEGGQGQHRASNTKLEEEVVAYIKDQIKDLRGGKFYLNPTRGV